MKARVNGTVGRAIKLYRRSIIIECGIRCKRVLLSNASGHDVRYVIDMAEAPLDSRRYKAWLLPLTLSAHVGGVIAILGAWIRCFRPVGWCAPAVFSGVNDDLRR